MVKNFIIRFLFDNGAKILRSILNAHKHVNASRANPNPNSNQNDNNQNGNKSMFEKLNLNNLVITPMTKDEAMKILSLDANQVREPKKIIEVTF